MLRRPPFGHKAKSAHDMGREYRILNQLKDGFPYCPKAYVHCTDESVIGAEVLCDGARQRHHPAVRPAG